MTKIIALIDGSDYSKSVCEYAAWIAKGAKGSVEILHSLARRDVPSTPSDMSGSIGFGARTALLEELSELDAQKSRLVQKRGRALLEDARNLIEENGVKNVSAKLRKDDIVDALEDFEADADLIVVGKRGQAADFAISHLGSNMERIVRSSTKPVLVASRNFQPIKKILVAFDGGKSTIKAVEHLAKSSVFAKKEIHLISVGEETPDAKSAIEGATAMLSEAGYKASSSIVSGSVEQTIADKVEKDGFDMLVIGAYGHSRIRNLIIGSTTTEMIRLCKVPVLMFR